jgi:hypothetical protein
MVVLIPPPFLERELGEGSDHMVAVQVVELGRSSTGYGHFSPSGSWYSEEIEALHVTHFLSCQSCQSGSSSSSSSPLSECGPGQEE